jgi:hypothetical protein
MKLVPSDASTDLHDYGYSVAVSGNTIAVGGLSVGAVYVFLKPATGWSTVNETAKLTASDAPQAWSVAIGGNAVAAGALDKIYLFVRPATGYGALAKPN